MSYEIDIREELVIHNENEKTRAAAARLRYRNRNMSCTIWKAAL